MRHVLFIAALLPALPSGLAQAADTLSSAVAQEVFTNSQTWRSNQDNSEFVIQLVSVREAKHLPSAKDIQAIKAVSPDLDVVYHPKRVKGVTWHTLVWGSFASPAEGKAMFNQLPARWQKMQPWVRPMSSIEGATPVVVAKASAPRPAPKPAPKKISNKHPVSPVNRSQFPSTPPKPEDAYENYGEDFSNHESAMAAQGTYPYVKLSLGQTEQDTDALIAASSINLESIEDSFVGNTYEIALGLDLGYYLGVELGYIDATALEPSINLNNRAIDSTTAAAFKEQGPFGFKGFKGSLIVKLPIDARRQWQPFVQVGAMQWKSEIPALGSNAATENKSTNLFYAAGLDYKFNKKWALGIKYSGYDMDAEARAVTADLTWRWEGRQ